MSEKPDNLIPLPAADVEQITDQIIAEGQAPQAIPPALTPAKIESMMARFFNDPTMKEMAGHTRGPGLPDEGQHDLGPLAMTVLEATRNGGPEAQGITFMFAAYGLWSFFQARQTKASEVTK